MLEFGYVNGVFKGSPEQTSQVYHINHFDMGVMNVLQNLT